MTRDELDEQVEDIIRMRSRYYREMSAHDVQWALKDRGFRDATLQMVRSSVRRLGPDKIRSDRRTENYRTQTWYLHTDYAPTRRRDADT